MNLSSISFEKSLDITNLLQIKLSLNKLGGFDNIEHYTLKSIYEMQKVYEKYVDDNDGLDISFPGFLVGKNAKTKAKHKQDESRRKSRNKRSK
jgi:hypothetical protein